MMLSEHFSSQELACRCGCGLCNPDPALLELAESVRVVLGNAPMAVHSACRCPEHNSRVGGANGSSHLSGQAMDFHAQGMTPEDARAAIADAYAAGLLPQLGGLGIYSWGLHIDTARAADGHLRQWDYR